jgi:hypothetical protein
MTASRTLTEAQLRALIMSIPIYCASTIFTLSGQTFTSAQLVTLITSVLNASTASTAAKATMTAALLAEEKLLTGNGALVREARDTLALMFNSVPETLSALAIVPRKPPTPLSAEARAAATAKAKATRLARGTTSKKQKATISGNVTGVTITPVTTPVVVATGTSSATPTPASPATSSGVVAAVTAPHS